MEGVDVLVVAADVDHAVGYRRAACDAAPGDVCPLDVSGGGVQRVELAVVAADVDRARADRRGAYDLSAQQAGPAPAAAGSIQCDALSL